MNTDKNAREFLDYYLDLDGDPEFAVLLEGPWGSGKSHFVDVYFRDRLEKARAEDKDAKDPLIRVTLYGVRDLSDITTQMFEKAHPILGGRAVKLVNNFGSRLGSVFGLDLDAKENTSLLESMTLNLQDRVLVFDDLERSPLPLVEVMGFINRFVEHDKLKVIVVASEDDIPEGQRKEYKGRKEKLIGKTIKVGSNPGEVLDVFVKRLKAPEVLAAIGENREKLLATFAASKRPNFRSLRAVLLDFERLTSLVDPRLRESKQAMGQLLLYMVALGLEFRSNKLDDAGLRDLQANIRLRLNLGAGAQKNTPEQTDAAELRKRYEHVAFDDPIVLPEHLADLFSSGSVDAQAVNDHLGRHPTVVGHAEVPAWRLMWSWSELSATDYRIARERFVTELTERRMTHPGQILHAAGSSLRLKRFGDDLLGEPVLDYVARYLAELEASDALVPAPSLFGQMGGSYGALVYNDNDTLEFAPIRTLVAEASARALERAMRAAAPELLARLRADPQDGSMLHEWGLDDGNYGGVAILEHIDVKDFADLALVDGKLNDKLLAALNERHNRGFATELRSELGWLESLRNELMARAGALCAPHRELAEMRIEYWFKEHDARIAASRV